MIDNGGTATIGPGDSVTDMTGGYGYLTIGGGGGGQYPGDPGGNGYVNMTGGVLQLSNGTGNFQTESLGVGYQPDGVTSSSGVFTQSGGVNMPYMQSQYSGEVSNLLLLGPNQGGYGEYNLSGGQLTPNCIYMALTPAQYGFRILAREYSTRPVGPSAKLASPLR